MHKLRKFLSFLLGSGGIARELASAGKTENDLESCLTLAGQVQTATARALAETETASEAGTVAKPELDD